MWGLGRKPKPLRDHRGRFSYQYPLDDPHYFEVMEKLQVIGKRESRTLDDLHKAAVSEYVERHYYGNYQTLLPSYDGASPKSNGQLEAEVVRYFKEKAVDAWEIYYRDIVVQVRSLMGVEGNKAAEAAERVVKALRDNQVRVVK